MRRPIDVQMGHRLTEEIMTGMCAWRLPHPQATLRAMEHELDVRWAHVRARMGADMALTRGTAAWPDTPAGQRPRCPDCDEPRQERGQEPRVRQTCGGQHLRVERSYGVCPACGSGRFPPR